MPSNTRLCIGGSSDTRVICARVENRQAKRVRIRLSNMLKPHAVIDTDSTGQLPVVLGIKGGDVLSQVCRRRKRLLKVASLTNSHQSIRIFIPCCPASPTGRSVCKDAHELAPVVLLVIEVFIVETIFCGVSSEYLGEVLADTGDTLDRDHVRVIIVPDIT